jgi:hypothetical protein
VRTRPKFDLGAFSVHAVNVSVVPSSRERGFLEIRVQPRVVPLGTSRTVSVVEWSHEGFGMQREERHGFDHAPSDLRIARTVPDDVNDETLARIVRSCVIEALAHEVDEWLRIDGVQVSEPHPEAPRTERVLLEVRR